MPRGAPGPSISLALTCLAKGVHPGLQTPLRNAIGDQAAAQLRTPPSWAEAKTKWPAILDCLAADDRAFLRGRLYEELRNSQGTAVAGFFELYGSELTQGAVLASRLEAMNEVVEPLLRERNLAGLVWVAAYLQAHPKSFAKKEGIYTVARDISRFLRDNVGHDVFGVVSTIADALEVRAAPPDAPAPPPDAT